MSELELEEVEPTEKDEKVDSLLNDHIKKGQERESKMLKKWMIADVFFYPALIFCLPFIVVAVILCVPVILVCCFPCICYLTKIHRPREAPWWFKLFSLVLKLLFWFFQRWRPRWAQTFLKCFFLVRSKIKKTGRIEKIEYFDHLRSKVTFAECFVHENENENHSSSEEEGESDQSENSDDEKVTICMYYFHGGGYLAGHPENHSLYYNKLLQEIDIRGSKIRMKIFALNYRKAPRYKVDSILLETVEVLKWIVKNNPNCKLLISGDSAGGHLCILLAHYLRDTNYAILPKRNVHVVSIYPVLLRNEDLASFEEEEIELESRTLYGKRGCLLWGKPMNRYYELVFQGDPFEGKYNNYDLFKNLEELPSQLIVTSDFDFLRSDGEIYYKKLTENNKKKKKRMEKKKVEESESSGEDDSESTEEEEEEEEEEEDGFEYFRYLCFDNEAHGFNTNFFHLVKGSKDRLVNEVISDLEKKFL